MPRDHRSSTSNKSDAGGGRSKRESSRSKPGSDGVKGSSKGKASSYGSSKSKDSGSRDRRRGEKNDDDRRKVNRVATLEGFKTEKKPSYDKKDDRYSTTYRFP